MRVLSSVETSVVESFGPLELGSYAEVRQEVERRLALFVGELRHEAWLDDQARRWGR